MRAQLTLQRNAVRQFSRHLRLDGRHLFLRRTVGWLTVAAICLAVSPSTAQLPDTVATGHSSDRKASADSVDPRSGYPDSFAYYGPQGLWRDWTDTQREGRDTWFFYTGGNQHFYRGLSQRFGKVGVSVEFFRLLDSRRRAQRFKKLGLINEPNFERNDTPDEYGLYLDKPKTHRDGRVGDPIEGAYPDSNNPEVKRWFGRPTGIVGLRLFDNPAFTPEMAAAWKENPNAKLAEHFDTPSAVEPPYLVGITCAFCHVAFDPTNPPLDPSNPRWEHLSANIGNQYFREGDIFFGWGRIVGGDANPPEPAASGPTSAAPDVVPAGGDDEASQAAVDSEIDRLWNTTGLDASSFLYQYGHTQQSGTSETSRFTYDFINNPNTINQILYLGNRAVFAETTPDGRPVNTFHVLKSGEDSVGPLAALGRVFINIGSESHYLLDRTWNPLTGTGPSPFSVAEVKRDASRVPEWRLQELEEFPGLGNTWQDIETRLPALASYLISYDRPFRLEQAVEAAVSRTDDPVTKERLTALLPSEDGVRRGAVLFARYCAKCHSNRQPFYPLGDDAESERAYHDRLLTSDEFRAGNTLTDDVRYPITFLGTNAARSFASNAVEGEIWSDFSSREYKALPSIGAMKFVTPVDVFPTERFGRVPIETTLHAPGGGRGYYRTASLVGLWATAPFLHNNGLGRDPYVEEHGGIDERYIGVEGRMELFDDAIRQLLGLKPRRDAASIKVTSQDSGVLAGLDGLRTYLLKQKIGVLIGFLEQEATSIVLEAIEAKPELSAEKKQVLKALAPTVIRELIARSEPKLAAFVQTTYVEKLEPPIIDAAAKAILAELAPKLAEHQELGPFLPPPDRLQQKIAERLREVARDLVEVDLVIPGGTPVNLLLNLDVRRAPYAVTAWVKNPNDKRTLYEELLKLSLCPDLVEDKGHEFPTPEERRRDRLSDQDLEDLIEFLKTL